VNPAAQDPPRPDTRATRSIIIVDDSETVTKALRITLGNAGYDVRAFGSGLAALRHAAHSRPDGAVVDIHLPDINGLVLTQRLRDLLGPDTPLIVLSGDTSMETINSLPHVGATYFFPKPVQGAQLIECLREWVD
jgi:CheY-like chemotaxis protein